MKPMNFFALLLITGLFILQGTASAETIRGQVSSIDPDQRLMTVTRIDETGMPGEIITLEVPENARMEGVGSLAEISVGDEVQVSTTEEVAEGRGAVRSLEALEAGELPEAGIAEGGQYQWSDKLGRGVINFFTSPLEIPRSINNRSEAEGAAAGWTAGLVAGAGRTLLRAGAGIVEVVTFPFDWPEEGKAPIVQPVYAWQDWSPRT